MDNLSETELDIENQNKYRIIKLEWKLDINLYCVENNHGGITPKDVILQSRRGYYLTEVILVVLVEMFARRDTRVSQDTFCED